MANPRVRKSLTALFALSLFGVVYFAKNWVVRDFGSDVPNWDQWDAEATELLIPWKAHTLRVPDLFHPHNEHRVVLTKLMTLGLVSLNGQWDARLQMVANGLIHSTLAVALWFWMRPLLVRRWQVLAWTVAIAATFAPPHAWQNVLGGFHSQQYFLLLLSLLGIDRTLRSERTTSGWWIGVTCLVLAIFSMGSGFFGAAAVVVVLLLLNGSPGLSVRKYGLTLLICTGIVAVGWLLRAEMPTHQHLKAQSVSEFGLTLWRALQWPVRLDRLKLFALLSHVPLLLLAWRVIRRPDDTGIDPRERVIVAAGIWVLAQFVAAAYARGAGGEWPASRYYDTQTLGLLVNCAAMLVLVSRTRWKSLARHAQTAGFALWSAGTGYGLWAHARGTLGELEIIGPTYAQYANHLRLYLASGDTSWLIEGEIPYPSADALRERVSHPEILALLPAGVRPALSLSESSSSGFSSNGASPATPRLLVAPNWGSFADGKGPASVGEWQSDILQPPGEGYLKFEIAGDLGAGSVRLEIWSADLSTRLATVSPSRVPGDSWRAAYVPAPRRPFRIIGHDSDPNAWVAFSAPITMATGSYWAWRLTAHSPLLFSISLVVLVLVLPFMLGCPPGSSNRMQTRTQ